jgi:2,3-diketo-5-methylthio-1-phosphopentane phosphatase
LPVLVTDFDGTITDTDIYMLIRARYMRPDEHEYFDEYRRGRMTHFEAMSAYLAHGPSSEAEWEALMRDAEPDPQLGGSVRALRDAGWEIVVSSAGALWYIERILARAGVTGVAVHANPGTFQPGAGLRIEMPTHSRFFSPTVGIDKEAIVRDAQSRSDTVAFAGDGPPDVSSAMLVKPELRFARGWLAAHFRQRGVAFVEYKRWSEVAEALVACSFEC